jgi:hypothetical protein
VKARSLAAAIALAFGSAAPAMATPAFVNGLTVPANTTDLSGDPIALNQRLGMFSDIYYDPNRNEWWGLSDRGAGGGTLPYDTRVQRFTIAINPTTGSISNFQVVQTVEFTGPLGTFNGLAPSPTNVLGRALDPEGFVVNPKTGRFLVSDEYGPSLYEFNRDGTLARTFTTPANLIGRNGTTGVPNFADDSGNTAGKRTNRGFEGLAISPDGKFTYAMLQSPMLDEGGLGNGRYNRIVKFDNATGLAVAQYAYLMEGSSQGRGISALVALNDHEFLVLERNNRGMGVASELTPPNKKVYKIDINGASDVSGITLPDSGPLPGGRVPVTKSATPFFSLDADTLAAFGSRVPEKLEGLAIGPRLADGQYLILAGTDNDFSVTQNAGSTTQFDVFYNPGSGARIQCDIGTFDHCFTINADGTLGAAFSGSAGGFDLIPGLLYAYKSTGSDLASFVSPAAVPLPATSTMLLAGLALVFLAARPRRT